MGELDGPVENLFYATSCRSRRLFDAADGYPSDGKGSDLALARHLEHKYPSSDQPFDMRPEDRYRMYCSGDTGSYHMSGPGANQLDASAGYEEVQTYVDAALIEGRSPRGPIQLRPTWHDYHADVFERILHSPKDEGA